MNNMIKKPIRKVVETGVSHENNQSAFDTLPQKYKIFIIAYLKNGMNGTKAYMEAYPHVKKETAEVNSCRLLRNARVKIVLDEEINKVWKGKDLDIELAKTLTAIRAIAFSNLFDIITIENGNLKVKDMKDIRPEAQLAIKGLDCTEKANEYGIDRKISIRMYSKVPALELLAKIQKMIDNKVEVPLDIVIKPAVRPLREEDK